jgi:hypothetical protein
MLTRRHGLRLAVLDVSDPISFGGKLIKGASHSGGEHIPTRELPLLAKSASDQAPGCQHRIRSASRFGSFANATPGGSWVSTNSCG